MWLKNWSFANRLNVSRGSVAKKLKDCLDFLTKIVSFFKILLTSVFGIFNSSTFVCSS